MALSSRVRILVSAKQPSGTTACLTPSVDVKITLVGPSAKTFARRDFQACFATKLPVAKVPRARIRVYANYGRMGRADAGSVLAHWDSVELNAAKSALSGGQGSLAMRELVVLSSPVKTTALVRW